MTPISGLLAAIAAGLLVRSSRQAMLAVIPPYLAVHAAQTWILGSGRGNNPASTITDPGYWVIQVVVLALALGVSALLSSWRTGRLDGARGSAVASRRIAAVTAVATPAAGLIALAIFSLTQPATPQSGSGGPPLIGVAGMLGLLLSLVVLGALRLQARRASSTSAGPRVAVGKAG